MQQGYIHIYTSNGKGKTTAALGLALRAICAGRNVYIGQFVKSMCYSETRLVDLLDDADASFGSLCIEQLGNGCCFDGAIGTEDILMAQKGWKHCMEVLQSGKWDVLVFDELTIALSLGLLRVDKVVQDLQVRNSEAEIIITGRYAPQELIDIADVVTDMCEIKHYYKNGVLSRKGIDC